ncbi:MAG: HD domain-containing protein [Clostridium sp.]|nr:HD domain-containing protein [Clostridium sp.]
MAITIDMPEEVSRILRGLESGGFEAYIAGECVRDSILGRKPLVWNIYTSAGAEEAGALFPGCQEVFAAGNNGSATLTAKGERCEAVLFEMKGSRPDGQKQDDREFWGGIEARLALKGFTVNAVAFSIGAGMVDPFKGLEDMGSRRIRCTGNPHQYFRQDALRILEAVDLGARLGFTMDHDTLQAALNNRELLGDCPAERIRPALLTIFSLGINGLICQLQSAEPIFTEILPEMKPMIGFLQNNPYHVFDVWNHTLEALKAANEDVIVRLTVFFHDIGKPCCYTEDEKGIGHFRGHGIVSAELTDGILGRLGFEDDTRMKITELVKYHDAVLRENHKNMKTWLNRLGEEQLRRLLEVRRCDITGQNPYYMPERIAKVERLSVMLDEVIEQAASFKIEDLAVTGSDLMGIGFLPGRRLGEALKGLAEQVRDCAVPNEKEALLTEAGILLAGDGEGL